MNKRLKSRDKLPTTLQSERSFYQLLAATMAKPHRRKPAVRPRALDLTSDSSPTVGPATPPALAIEPLLPPQAVTSWDQPPTRQAVAARLVPPDTLFPELDPIAEAPASTRPAEMPTPITTPEPVEPAVASPAPGTISAAQSLLAERASEGTPLPAAPELKELLADLEEIRTGVKPRSEQASYANIQRELMQALGRPGLTPLTEPASSAYSSPWRTPALSAGATLNYGVVGGMVTDPYYRTTEEKKALTGRTQGRDYHGGIDISLSHAKGGGLEDQRRGLPAYACIRTVLSFNELDSIRVGGRNESGTGLGFSGSGSARLRHAKVLTQPWSPTDAGSYGGVLGLACVYDYNKPDGSPGVFTIYVEFLHLITESYPPKNGSGEIISIESYKVAGKSLGFGPLMTNTAILTKEQIDSAPVVGYLGASEFPHLHVQASFGEGERGYIKSPRLDPTIILATGLSAPISVTAQSLPSPEEITYSVPAGREWGPVHHSHRPGGLPEKTRQASEAGAAAVWVERVAGEMGLDETFTRLIMHLAQTESASTFARPADRFDARPEAERGGKPLVTAWGVFQFNRDAWTDLIPQAQRAGRSSFKSRGEGNCRAAGGCVYPWDATAYEELVLPIQKYASIYRAVQEAGGNSIDAARGVRLWQRSPAIEYPGFLANGRVGDFATAWEIVDVGHRTAVDAHLSQNGILVEGVPS